MNETFDVVIVGSGINSLVASAELAKAGWSVAIIERNEKIGGFIASEERTRPGYQHDVFSSWHPQFVSGGGYAALGEELHQHGLKYANTDDALCATVSDDGTATFAYRDIEKTGAGFEHPEDAQSYAAAIGRFFESAEGIGGFMSSELRSTAALKNGFSVLRSSGKRGSEGWLRDLATSGRAWCHREFIGQEVERLWIPWLLHAGLSPDQASGGLMIPVFAATLHGGGMPVVVGGAGNFLAAFESLLNSYGVTILTGTNVDQILVEGGRATGVSCGGRNMTANKAVLASVTPTALYGQLLPQAAVGRRVREEAEEFRYGRAAMQLHVALSKPVEWKDQRLNEFPLVHLSNGAASTGIACAQAEAGLLPSEPTAVVGMQYVLDPSRVPEGAGSLWIQLQELPFELKGDALGQIDTDAGWNAETGHAYARRVLDRLGRHVHGLDESILEVDVLTPADLSERNINAVRGDPYGGAAGLDQNFLWRPLPSQATHATEVQNLWQIGASTHPGAGLGAGSGHMVAQGLLTPGPIERTRESIAKLLKR